MPAPRKRPGADAGKGSATKLGPFARKTAETQPEKPDDGYGDDEYAELIREAVHKTEREMLYVPPKPTMDVPELPEDWSTISPKQLQTLHGAFATYALRAGYLEKIEEAKAMICKAAADELFDALFSQMTVGKDASVTHLKSQVESDPNVRRWRKRQQKHTAFALSHKMDRDGYQKITEALSRLHTMKQDEWVQAGGKIGK